MDLVLFRPIKRRAGRWADLYLAVWVSSRPPGVAPGLPAPLVWMAASPLFYITVLGDGEFTIAISAG